jgi:hypothetical protein
MGLLTGTISGQRFSRSAKGITPGPGRVGGRHRTDLYGPALSADVAVCRIHSPGPQGCASLRRAQKR